jgi:general secretion pathway protein A
MTPENPKYKEGKMEYFELLNLKREPFSNSPDPESFYPARQHIGCLQKLELSIRLQRGLNVVIGDIGTGKSTLCRHLVRRFAADDHIETHLIFDPDFDTPIGFLSTLAGLFGVSVELHAEDSRCLIKESIKNYLFRKGVEEKKTVVLIIDEGQKTPEFCLEILRELLNYETNEHKLLQIVIFAQREFQQTIAGHPNFADRINLYHVLAPLNFRETRKLLQFRLNQAGDYSKEPKLFTSMGLWAVYRATGGYPRKIIHLGHRVLVTMIIQNRVKAGWSAVRWCSKMLYPGTPLRMPWAGLSFVAVLLMILALATIAPEQFEMTFFNEIMTKIKTGLTQQEGQSSPLAVKRFHIPVPANIVEPERNAVENEGSNSELAEPQNATLSTTGQPISVLGDAPVFSEVLSLAGSQDSVADEPAELFEKSPETTQSLSVAESHPPEILGEITMRYGDTLETLIRKVYGHLDQQYLKVVMHFNPQITDMNNVEIGRPISFPALPFRVGSLRRNGHWVQVAERNTLKDAYQVLTSHPRNAPPVCMLPYWNSRDGLRFSILLKDCCVDEQSAEVALRGLPQSLASNARILNQLGEENEAQVLLAK